MASNQWLCKFWTDENDALLTKLWGERIRCQNGKLRWLSCQEIAERMKITKNSVIGRVHRINLTPRKVGAQYAPEGEIEIVAQPKPRFKPEPALKLQKDLDHKRIHALMEKYF